MSQDIPLVENSIHNRESTLKYEVNRFICKVEANGT